MKLEDRRNRYCTVCQMKMATDEPDNLERTVHDKCLQAKPRSRLKLSDRLTARTSLHLLPIRYITVLQKEMHSLVEINPLLKGTG